MGKNQTNINYAFLFLALIVLFFNFWVGTSFLVKLFSVLSLGLSYYISQNSGADGNASETLYFIGSLFLEAFPILLFCGLILFIAYGVYSLVVGGVGVVSSLFQ
eukprot:TRINITY_DN3809_c0_g1_i1.p1 TRINITY_DN3809_c0_g1~~TRINITY_DN3809_c0_g1_i1.p1  ORF type:complete len:104 (+),score=16.92 TRINITY_DN3809_c0_g1_i1:199-510(+)